MPTGHSPLLEAEAGRLTKRAKIVLAFDFIFYEVQIQFRSEEKVYKLMD